MENILGVKIDKELLNTARDVTFLGTYIHPVNSIFYADKEFENTLDMLEQVIADQVDQNNDTDFIVSGDLNSRIGEWEYKENEEDSWDIEDELKYRRKVTDNVTNSNGKKTIELCTTFNLTPLDGLIEKDFNSSYTFFSARGNSTIDHFLCSTTLIDNIYKFKVLDRVETSHLPIYIEVQSTLGRQEEPEGRPLHQKKITWQEDKTQECLDILNTPESEEKLNQAIQEIDTNIETSLDNFNSLMTGIGKPMVSNLTIGGKQRLNKGWYDKECQEKRKETRYALRKLLRSNRNNDQVQHDEKRANYIKKRIEYQRLIKNKKKQYRIDTYQKLIDNKKDSKKFWKTIRGVFARRNKVANISLNKWEEHFSQLLNPQQEMDEARDESHEEIPNTTQQREANTITDDMLDKEISNEEIKQACQKMKNGKAAGMDGLPSELLKLAEDKIRPYLNKLFNKIFLTGSFPLKWSKAIIVPIFKKGDKQLTGNYRGISLLCILSKIFTSILNARIYLWAENNNKISREQAGFRKSYSTIDHIFTLQNIASNCLFGRKRTKLYVAFIDFRKAFDTVRREVLWEILESQGLSSKMLRMLKGIYKKVLACVKQGNEQTNYFNCPLGVKQGCQLSPLLFSLLITEVAKRVARFGRSGYQLLPGTKEIYSLLFADDIALIATTPAGLQNQINHLKIAAEQLGLAANLDKTKIIVFRKGGYLGQYEKWVYGRDQIEVVNSYKYLGYTLTTKISADIALAEYAGRAKGKVFDIFRSLFKLGHIDSNIFFQLFDSQVKPMMLYAAEIWGMTKYSTIEKIHSFACKKLLGVSLRTPNALVYGELGRFPIYIDSTIKAIKYWFKILQLPRDRIPRQVYERDKLEASKTHGWANGIKHLLESNGFGYVWLSEGTPNSKAFIRTLKQRLIDCYKQNWHSKITTSERCATYASFKEDHTKEHYIEQIQIAKYRRTFTKLRLGITEINNNKRFRNINAQKNCPFCTSTEDEQHILLKCHMYNRLRTKYIAKHWTTLNALSLKDLLQNKNEVITREIAIFTYHALQKRENNI